MSRRLNIHPDIILPRKIHRKLYILCRRRINHIYGISQPTARRVCFREAGIIIHVVPSHADGVVLVKREVGPLIRN
jgi:hypothetical protein